MPASIGFEDLPRQLLFRLPDTGLPCRASLADNDTLDDAARYYSASAAIRDNDLRPDRRCEAA